MKDAKKNVLNVLICPDSFKGTLSAYEAAVAIESGVRKAIPKSDIADIVLCPIADGGDGTLDVLELIGSFNKITLQVTGPLGKKVEAFYLVDGSGTAYIEMARAAGIILLSEKQRSILDTTTFGVGELIVSAINQGCKKIILFIGGSATNDCGIGMAQALGLEFIDKENKNIVDSNNKYLSAKDLGTINEIRFSDRFKIIQNKFLNHDIEMLIACDAENILYGPQGAVYTYGAQKGATPELMKIIDANVKNFSGIIKKTFRKDIANIKGTGAAGGLAVPLVAFLGAKIVSGIKLISEITHLEEKISCCDMVITGEGRVDWQSLHGKALSGIISSAKKFKRPVIIVAGSYGKDYEKILLTGTGVSVMVASVIDDNPDWDWLCKNSKILLRDASEKAVKIFLEQSL